MAALVQGHNTKNDDARLHALYFQSMLVHHQVTLFTRTHQKMLQSLYALPSQERQDEMEEVWDLMEAFLCDQGVLVYLSIRLRQGHAAVPYITHTVPNKPPPTSNSSSNNNNSRSGGGGNETEGWRITRSMLHDTLLCDQQQYHAKCRRHGRLYEAVEKELATLSSAMALARSASSSSSHSSSSSKRQQAEAAGGGEGLLAAEEISPLLMEMENNDNMMMQQNQEEEVRLPATIDTHLQDVDQIVTIEHKMALWHQLKHVMVNLCSLHPR